MNNFSTVRPCFTTNIPTDSGRHAEKRGTIKHVPNFTLGEQPGIYCENTPNITFQPRNQFPQTIYQLIHLDNRKHTKTFHNSFQCSNWRNSHGKKYPLEKLFNRSTGLSQIVFWSIHLNTGNKINTLKFSSFRSRGASREFS
jgi:hypothetical protein